MVVRFKLAMTLSASFVHRLLKILNYYEVFFEHQLRASTVPEPSKNSFSIHPDTLLCMPEINVLQPDPRPDVAHLPQ